MDVFSSYNFNKGISPYFVRRNDMAKKHSRTGTQQKQEACLAARNPTIIQIFIRRRNRTKYKIKEISNLC